MPEVDYLEASALKGRQFIVIEGITLYRSTGESSGEMLKHTWLPCLGFPGPKNPYAVLKDYLITKSHDVSQGGKPLIGKCPESWIIKIRFLNHDKNIPQDIESILDAKLGSLYPMTEGSPEESQAHFDMNDFTERMGYIRAAIMSAKLGGGIWESEFGQAFKSKLDTLYPDYEVDKSYSLGRRYSIFESAPRAFRIVNQALQSRGAAFDLDLMSLSGHASVPSM
jgi:hypothetical protein